MVSQTVYFAICTLALILGLYTVITTTRFLPHSPRTPILRSVWVASGVLLIQVSIQTAVGVLGILDVSVHTIYWIAAVARLGDVVLFFLIYWIGWSVWRRRPPPPELEDSL